MCGICGIISPHEKIERSVLERMNHALEHRGPDDQGMWIGGGVGLAHRRLSIIDLSGGHQPMQDHSGRIHIVFNGEIYNFHEIARQLAQAGLTPKTQSDTEVLLLSYRLWGKDCLSRFNGMFALAIWDEEKQELFLARDRLGKKPLYYFMNEKSLVFASEIKSLLRHPEASRDLDAASLSKYFAYDYIPAPRSIFKQIKKLESASYAIWKKGSLHITRYWEPNFQTIRESGEAELLEELDSLLKESVRMRLISDVPLGVFLSGGLDSSAVVSYMAQFVPAKQIKTFTMGFEEESFDERSYARIIARHFDTDHHEQILSPQVALDLVPRLADVLDEPMADPSIIPTYLLSQFTRKQVKVALGGDGGDEVFVGYENYRAAKIAPYYLQIPSLIRRGLIETTFRNIPTSEKNLSFDYKLKRFTKGIDFPQPVQNYVWLGSLTPSEQKEIFTREFYETLPTKKLEDLYDEAFSFQSINPKETLHGLLASDLQLYLQEDILVKVDRASMANSLEVRAPFLDYRIVDLLASVPLKTKFPGLQLKYLLKKIMRPKLPREIIERPKKGFGIPVTRWIKRDLSAFFEEVLGVYRLRKEKIFRPEVVRKLLQEHKSGVHDHRKVLWALLIFELWRERYKGTLI